MALFFCNSSMNFVFGWDLLNCTYCDALGRQKNSIRSTGLAHVPVRLFYLENKAGRDNSGCHVAIYATLPSKPSSTNSKKYLKK